MEFWGEEVKSGQPLKVKTGDDKVLHLSQACLGEAKKGKGNETVNLFVNVDGKKLVLGTLSTEKIPQQQFDLVFDQDFEITHNWKNGSVYLYGYRADNPIDDEEELFFDATGFPVGEFDDSEEEEAIPLALPNNGQSEPKTKSNAGKNKVTIVEPSKADSDSDDSDDFEGDSDEDDSDDSDDSEEETPKKVESSKKRAPESASKTPVSSKKAKTTPLKTDGKKVSGHVATPHPAKGKTPANKQNTQTPKSAGAHCGSCNRTFKSDEGLDSHNKAKHSAAK